MRSNLCGACVRYGIDISLACTVRRSVAYFFLTFILTLECWSYSVLVQWIKLENQRRDHQAKL